MPHATKPPREQVASTKALQKNTIGFGTVSVINTSAAIHSPPEAKPCTKRMIKNRTADIVPHSAYVGMFGIKIHEMDIKNVVDIKTGTRPMASPMYPQKNAASGLMQNDEQKVKVARIGVKLESGGKKILVSTKVMCTASIKSKNSKKFPINMMATDFLTEDDIFFCSEVICIHSLPYYFFNFSTLQIYNTENMFKVKIELFKKKQLNIINFKQI